MDMETGEVLKDKFAQMYFKDIEKLFSLSSTDMHILLLMVKSIGLGNCQTIEMTPKRKKEFAKKIGLKNYRNVSSSLTSMCKSGIIKKRNQEEMFDFFYTINPDIFFSGNEYQRVKVLIDYSEGSRKLKAFKNEEDLTSFLKKQKGGSDGEL